MTDKNTDQIDFWKGEFGNEYTRRNPHSVAEENEAYVRLFGVTRDSMNEEFIGGLDRSLKILEVGANLGLQLENLRTMGFTNAMGVEINAHAIEEAKRLHLEVHIQEGTAFNLPFDDGSFDLVYTSGVLIHIAPKDLPDAMKEIYRTSKRYVWGFEYYADKPEDINYRGNTGFLWKRNFAAYYQELFPDLKLVRAKNYRYLGDTVEDQMFLLEKPQA